MPNFWLTMLLRHPKLENVLTFSDRKNFRENPYFENEKLSKTVEFSDDKTLTTIGTTINWKGRYEVLTRRHYHENSFFNWFSTPKEEVEHDLIAEMIKGEIWANPLLDTVDKDDDDDDDDDDVEEEVSVDDDYNDDDDDDDDDGDDDGGVGVYYGDEDDSDSAYSNLIYQLQTNT